MYEKKTRAYGNFWSRRRVASRRLWKLDDFCERVRELDNSSSSPLPLLGYKLFSSSQITIMVFLFVRLFPYSFASKRQFGILSLFYASTMKRKNSRSGRKMQKKNEKLQFKSSCLELRTSASRAIQSVYDLIKIKISKSRKNEKENEKKS